MVFLPKSLAFLATAAHYRIRVGNDSLDDLAFVVEFFPFAYADAMIIMTDVQVGAIVSVNFIFAVFLAVNVCGFGLNASVLVVGFPFAVAKVILDVAGHIFLLARAVVHFANLFAGEVAVGVNFVVIYNLGRTIRVQFNHSATWQRVVGVNFGLLTLAGARNSEDDKQDKSYVFQ